MQASSTLAEQLAILGVHLPAWPEEPEGDEPGNWIQRGQAYAEGLRLWRAQLRNASENTKKVVDLLVQHLSETDQLETWDELAYATIKPEVQGSPDYERWQTCTKIIRLSALKPAHLLGITLEMAREQRLAAAIYGLKRLLKEKNDISRTEEIQLAAEVIIAFNTTALMKDARADLTGWKRAVATHHEFAGLIAGEMPENESADSAQCLDKTVPSQLLDRLDAISNQLGSKGAHGHMAFIQICREKLPALLQDWTGEQLWIAEVGCSREIIEGQNSTLQILAVARDLGLRFVGIDLDHENIEALSRDYKESRARWIVGKGEDELKAWDEPIAACYLDAYDFWHESHSAIRQKPYTKNYGAEINDSECHAMHLKVARHCSRLIPPGGLLGLDDTWLEDDQWAGKGALALPWLIEHGWQLLLQANRSAVLARLDPAG